VGGNVSNSVSMLVLSCADACAEVLKLLPRPLPGLGLAESMLLSPSPEFESHLLEMGDFLARMAGDVSSNTKGCLVPGHSEMQERLASDPQSKADLEMQGSRLLEYFCDRPMPATVSLLLQCLTKAGCSWHKFAGGCTGSHDLSLLHRAMRSGSEVGGPELGCAGMHVTHGVCWHARHTQCMPS
jgi:hypothetical protein